LSDVHDDHPIVVGLPRGGVVVAEEVAKAVSAPLDVVIVAKVVSPDNPELALGAVGEEAVTIRSEELIRALGIGHVTFDSLAAPAVKLVADRVSKLRGAVAPIPVASRTVILVDDGVATGATAQAAIAILRARGAGRIVMATPVSSSEGAERLRPLCDRFVCVDQPDQFYAVGSWYRSFDQVSDEEVAGILRAGLVPPIDVTIPADGHDLPGILRLPHNAQGLVIFAHGSGSSRLSPRNELVADRLSEAGLGSLLFDLLTEPESEDRANVFDIELLSRRVVAAIDHVRTRSDTRHMTIGLFGASTGAAAALCAASEEGTRIPAVVSRGGRPDLAMGRLRSVAAPTLLIVGGEDRPVIAMNREAASMMRCPVTIEIVPGATHLFEEPGALERVADLAAEFFREHLGSRVIGNNDSDTECGHAPSRVPSHLGAERRRGGA
jgi:putative phosphoribosyl transferase